MGKRQSTSGSTRMARCIDLQGESEPLYATIKQNNPQQVWRSRSERQAKPRQ
jgi:hypothetical protein